MCSDTVTSATPTSTSSVKTPAWPRPDLLSGLNPAQVRAVTGDAPALVIAAGPGSGKTRVISYRIAVDIAKGVAPSRILAITFTNRAAAEMRERVEELVGEPNVAIGTFHWLGQQILRRHGDRLGLRRDFRLLGAGEARRVLLRAMRESGDTAARVADVRAAISAVKNGAPALEAAGISKEALADIAHRYRRALNSYSAIDLDDLLWLTVRLLETDRRSREYWQRAWDEILVDEFQDTNPIQYRLLQLLSGSARVVVVGDEDQAIYGWRLAEPEVMQRFLADFPGADLIKLEQNYRSGKLILRAAQALIEENKGRIERKLWTDNPAGVRPTVFVADDEVEEAEWVASRLAAEIAHGRSPRDMAVLFRTNAQSRAIEEALVRHGIPYDVSVGERFLEREEIRRAAAWLRLALDVEDTEAALYLLSFLRGVGPRRLEALREEAERSGEPVLTVAGREGVLPAAVREATIELAGRIERVRALRGGPVERLLEEVVATVGRELDLAPIERETALDNLAELHSLARPNGARPITLRELIDRLALTTTKTEGEGVRLLTLHAAKGLEFPIVFVVGLEEELLPHRRSLDRDEDVREERRLLYVGMTRAADRLYLSYAHTRLLGGRLGVGTPSRFIGEIGRTHFDLQDTTRRAPRPRLHRVRVGERIKHQRWGPGSVAGVEGAGRDTMVTIMFDNGSRQRIQLRHAPLTRLNPQDDVLTG